MSLLRPVALLFLILCACGGPNVEYPRVTAGILDLRGWDFERDGAARLDGDWEFYWQRLLMPADLRGERPPRIDGFIAVPGLWNGQRPGDMTELPGEGFATYRVQVRLPPDSGMLGMYVPGVRTSYELYINGDLLTNNGRPGRSPESTRPEALPHVLVFPTPEDGRLDLILRVANFDHRKGGTEYRFLLGPERPIRDWHLRRVSFEHFVSGALVIMGIYHLGLFMLRRRDGSSLYFGLFCLVIMVRTLSANGGERFFATLLPPGHYTLLVRLEFLGFYLATPLFSAFVRSVFPDRFSDRWLLVMVVVGSIFSLIVVLTPVSVFNRTALTYSIFTLVSIFYLIYIVTRAATEGRAGALLFLGGTILLAATVINDVLFSNGVIYSFMLVPFGLFLFIFIQAFLLSSRFARALVTEEMLTGSLERKVADRTVELREAYDSLSAIDRAKTDFFTNISHEIRTPLTLILTPLEAILARPAGIDAENRNSLRLMHRNGRQLLGLVNDLLDISRLDADKTELRMIETDITRLVARVRDQFVPAARARGIELRQTGPRDGIHCVTDPEKIERALSNLLQNAIKFTRRGSVTISVSRADDGTSCIEVHDTGAGIEPERIDSIFERFNTSYTGRIGTDAGTGIGLYLVKRIMELHGGTVSVESSPGRGSCFRLHLPERPAPNASPGKEPETDPVALPSVIEPADSESDAAIPSSPGTPVAPPEATLVELGVRETVLVVEDNRDLRAFLVSLLRPVYRIVTARDGAEGLRRARHFQPGAIVSDVMMPIMDGVEMLRRLKQDDDLAQIPVLMLSARAELEDRLEGLNLGADDYMAKPFYAMEVRSRINTLLLRGRLRELAVARMRESIFADFHDHLGGNLTDLSISIQNLARDVQSTPRLDAAVDAVKRNFMRTSRAFRDQLASADDLKLLEEDFLDGLNLILLRRYANHKRPLNYRAAPEARRLLLSSRVRGTMIKELYAVAQELASNDLKHGQGETTWSFRTHEDDLIIDTTTLLNGAEASETGTTPRDESTTSYGMGNIRRRVAAADGEVAIKMEDGSFQVMVRWPVR